MKLAAPIENRSPQLAYFHKKAELNNALGLTDHGTRYKRRPNAKTPEERKRMAYDRSVKAAGKRIVLNKLAGLTTRGTEKIYVTRRGDVLILKSEIDALARSLAKEFVGVSAETRAQILEMEKNLSIVRNRII